MLDESTVVGRSKVIVLCGVVILLLFMLALLAVVPNSPYKKFLLAVILVYIFVSFLTWSIRASRHQPEEKDRKHK